MATVKLEELLDVLRGFHNAMLVTRNDGELHMRTMAVAKLEGDGDLWFATASD